MGWYQRRVHGDLIKKMPENMIYSCLGFVLCFFGGCFPATIAMIEAWRQCGGKHALKELHSLYKQMKKVKDASKKDDEQDQDGDGVADVDQIPAQELAKRKVTVVLKTVDAEKLNKDLSGLYKGWIAVVAVLKVRFAKTVSLGAVIGDKIYETIVSRYVEGMAAAVPEEYRQWVPVVLRWVCSAVAITIAWWIQRVISAVHSAIRGGIIFARNIIEYLQEAGFIKEGSCDSRLEEMAGWSLAIVGILFQLSRGFSLPFPLSIFLLPARLLETFVVWSVGS